MYLYELVHSSRLPSILRRFSSLVNELKSISLVSPRGDVDTAASGKSNLFVYPAKPPIGRCWVLRFQTFRGSCAARFFQIEDPDHESEIWLPLTPSLGLSHVRMCPVGLVSLANGDRGMTPQIAGI
jgi:hypothetical protein